MRRGNNPAATVVTAVEQRNLTPQFDGVLVAGPTAPVQTAAVTQSGLPAQVGLFGQLSAFLGLPGAPATAAPTIENYIWTNVERMRALNPYVPGATNREVMPQASPLTPILALMGSGLLSYSFPTISYLG